MGLLSLFGWGKIAVLAGVAIIGFIGYSSVQTVISNYSEMSAKIERLEHKSNLFKQREISYKRRIARRDMAIAASKCNKTISRWVRNPSEIPKKFDPFKNGPLSAPN